MPQAGQTVSVRQVRAQLNELAEGDPMRRVLGLYADYLQIFVDDRELPNHPDWSQCCEPHRALKARDIAVTQAAEALHDDLEIPMPKHSALAPLWWQHLGVDHPINANIVE